MAVIACGLSFWLSACVDSSAPVPPVIPLTDLHSRLVLTPDAVVMVVGERLPVTVAALNLLGEPFSVEGGAPIVWTSSDTASVEMDANGMIYAKQVPSSGMGVVLQGMWKHNGIERGGTVFVTVTPTKYPIAKLKIVPKDSARTSWSEVSFFDGFTGFSVVAAKDNGDTVATLPLFVTANRRTIMVYSGDMAMIFFGAPYVISSRSVGPYWLHTHASVYGTMLRDSAQFMGLYAYNAQIPITLDSATNAAGSPYANQEVLVQPCGEIQFNNKMQTPIDIIFDDPHKATGCVPGDPTGNIEEIGAQATVGRKFRAAGTVQWTVRDRATGRLSARGTITMKEP